MDVFARPDKDRIAQAMSLWPTVASELGATPDGWRTTLLHRRQASWTDGVVLRLSRRGNYYVLKHEAGAERATAFRAEIQGLRDAYEMFPGDTAFRIPKVLAMHPTEPLVVMEYADAVPLATRLRWLRAKRHLPYLTRAGAWLDRLHRARPCEPRIFRPWATTGHLETLVDQVAVGDTQVAALDEFVIAARHCLSQRKDFAKRDTVAAVAHGDYHLRNLLVGDATWGIDVLPKGHRAVGHDVARFLVHYATFFASHKDIAQGEILPIAASDAFFKGYTLVGPDDPGVQFLMRHRILADWWRLSPDEGRMSDMEAARLFGLRQLAKKAFG